MSARVLRYSRVNAELRGMVSRLISAEERRTMASSNTVEDALRLLERTAYGDEIGALLRTQTSLPDVERALNQNLVATYRRVTDILSGQARGLVEELARRFEVGNMKLILRGIANHEPPDVTRSLLVPLGPLSRLPIDELMRADSVAAVADVLAGTRYGRVLAAALPRYSQENSLFPVEVALDLHYYRRLWDGVESLSDLDRQAAREFMGARYDALNIAWIARFRLIYRLSPEEIFNYALPQGRRVNDEVIRHAASATDAPGLLASLPQPYRTALAPAERADDPVERLEVLINRFLTGAAWAELAGYPFHIGVPLAYLWLKEAEVHDLRAILEGIRAGKSPDSIEAALWGAA